MTLIISEKKEKTIEEVKELVRGIIDNSPDEIQAIREINQIEGAKVKKSHSNGMTGSFTFFVKIDFSEEKSTIVPITTRFRR